MLMMRFKQYLNEDKDYDAKIKDIIKNVDPDYLKIFLGSKHGNCIWRGRNGDTDQNIVIMPHPVGRVSANTSNEFTLLVDNVLPSWKKYPKRSESFICSTDDGSAGQFGDVFRVLPYGKPKIGICNSVDMWWSFQNNYKKYGEGEEPEQVPLFNKMLYVMNEAMTGGKTRLSTVKELKHMFELVDWTVKNDKVDGVLINLKQHEKIYGVKFAMRLLKETVKTKSFLKTIDSVLNPAENDIELMDPITLFNAGNKFSDREVWLSSKCAFIRWSDEEEIKGRMKFLMKDKK